MKIAIVHNLPAGGAMRVMFEQVSRLAKKHTVDVFTLSTSNNSFLPLRKIVHRETSIKFEYPDHFPFTLIAIYFRLHNAYKEMAGLINNGNYDLAYVFPCFLTQTPFILRDLKIPSVYFCPETKREFYEKIPRSGKKLTYYLTLPFRQFIKKIDFDNIHRAGKILTLSNYNKEIIKKYYGLESEIIPLGVNTDIFFPLNIPKKNSVLSVGNFTLLKGHDFVIKAISQIPKEIRPGFLIVGFAGSDKKYLQDLAKELKVDMKCIDSPDDAQLNRLYNEAWLFIFAALKEPYGLVILEASAAGVRSLAVDDGGVPEVVTEKIMGQVLPRRENLFSQGIREQLSKAYTTKEIIIRRDYITKNKSWSISLKKLENNFTNLDPV